MELREWICNIYETLDEEISCSECLDQISGYVEQELNGPIQYQAFAPLRAHLRQCTVCRQEYELLQLLIQGEQAGTLPSAAELEGQLRDS